MTGRHGAPWRALPPGALAVGGGLVAASVTTYAFLALSARALGPVDHAPVAVAWSLLFLVVPTVWTPIEQETVRLLSARAGRHEGGGPVVRAGARTALVVGGPLVALLAVATVVGAGELFAGRVGVALALVAAVVAFAPNHLTRAALAATGDFTRYGRCIALDSATRLALAGAVVAVGIGSPELFVGVVAVAPLVPVVVFARRWGAAAAPGPPVGSSLRGPVVRLVGAQAFAQALVNGGPVAVAVLAGPGEEAVAARFLAALLVARIPLFFFQAVQSSLLPRLARLRADDDPDGFADQVRRLVGLVGVLAVVAVAGAATVGDAVVRIGFGDDFVLPGRDLALLALAAGLVMVAFVLAHAAVALAAHGAVTAGWAAGVAAAGIATALGDDLVWRVGVGLVVGGGIAVLAHAGTVVGGVSSWRRSPRRPQRSEPPESGGSTGSRDDCEQRPGRR